MVEQLDATGVQKRQQVVIQIALRSRGLLEIDPVLGEPSTRPFAGILVANDLSPRHNGAAKRRIAPPQPRDRTAADIRATRRECRQRCDRDAQSPASTSPRRRPTDHEGAVGHTRLRRQLGRSHMVTASTVSRETKSAKSVRNSPPYSAFALSGSPSYASSMTACRRRVHLRRAGLPDQDARIVLAEVPAIGVVKLAPLRYGLDAISNTSPGCSPCPAAARAEFRHRG